MIDTEVQRLRRLRNTALKARALAVALESTPVRRRSVLSRSAVSCWLIVRVVTGRLRAHPYLRYQRGPSDVRAGYDRISASVIGGIARRRGRGLQTLSVELQRVVRELADARALTWSADLSDTFGRSQGQIETLIKEVKAGMRNEAGSYHETDARADSEPCASVDNSGNAAANWPYLTF
jgi:hypothetical protein